MDFYRGLAYGLGEEPKFRKVDLFRQIQQGIEWMALERKITPVFILDEMHMAKDAFLQDVALLFTFPIDSTNPFILLLPGLPHLKTRLQLNHHRLLSQRLIMKYEIQALSREEVTPYIEHHMKLAGAKMPIFTESTIEAIALRSQGWSRAINTLAVNSLLFGSQLKKEQIDDEVVRLAVEESGMTWSGEFWYMTNRTGMARLDCATTLLGPTMLHIRTMDIETVLQRLSWIGFVHYLKVWLLAEATAILNAPAEYRLAYFLYKLYKRKDK
jgi:hypothetical protein